MNTGKERAKIAVEEFKNCFTVNSGKFNNGPIRKIERDRYQSKEPTQHLEFGDKPKTEQERVMKSLDFNKVDAVPVINALFI